jgi:protein required for attachment to host cells
MSNAKEAWILVVDSEQARLLHATATEHGRVHIDEMSKLATTFLPGEHQRPTQMGQPGGHGASIDHEPARKQAHFARQITAWIAPELTARSITCCNLFAPSHMLGALRSELPAPVARKLREHTRELTKLSPGELAQHPAIAALLTSQQDASGSHMA